MDQENTPKKIKNGGKTNPSIKHPHTRKQFFFYFNKIESDTIHLSVTQRELQRLNSVEHSLHTVDGPNRKEAGELNGGGQRERRRRRLRALSREACDAAAAHGERGRPLHRRVVGAAPPGVAPLVVLLHQRLLRVRSRSRRGTLRLHGQGRCGVEARTLQDTQNAVETALLLLHQFVVRQLRRLLRCGMGDCGAGGACFGCVPGRPPVAPTVIAPACT